MRQTGVAPQCPSNCDRHLPGVPSHAQFQCAQSGTQHFRYAVCATAFRAIRRQPDRRSFQATSPNQDSQAKNTITGRRLAKFPVSFTSARMPPMTVQAVINAPGSRHHAFSLMSGKLPTRNHWKATTKTNARSACRFAELAAASSEIVGPRQRPAFILPAIDQSGAQYTLHPVKKSVGKVADCSTSACAGYRVVIEQGSRSNATVSPAREPC